MAPRKKRPTDNRDTIISAITAPLGFYVLSLFIVESFLGVVLVGSNLDPTSKLVGMWAGIVIFAAIVIAVSLLVWFKPSNLTFDKHAHLIDRGKIPYGTEQERLPPREVFKSTDKEEEKQ